MIIRREWDLEIEVDQVLRGQGAEPDTVRSRSPQLVQLAEQALVEGPSLVQPAVLYQRMDALSLHHKRLQLRGNFELRGPLIQDHLAAVKRVIIVLCTIGERLENAASKAIATDPPYGLALDGYGSAAVEALANAACKHFEQEAETEGMQTTIPLSPGMVGWPLEEGQALIFNILDASAIGVSLAPSSIMHPKKTLSFVVGEGYDITSGETACAYCNMRETCRYQDHYAQEVT